jgi:hypothetical protein
MKRDNNYYLQRIKKDAPRVYADYLAGKYKSVREARRAAGLMSEPTQLHYLKNAWKRASTAQRKQFVAWARAGLPRPTKVASLFDPDGRLTSAGKMELKRTLEDHKMAVSDMMLTVGRSRLDPSVSLAMTCGYKVSPLTRGLVDAWFVKNGKP